MGIVFVDHFILKFMMFLSRINMCIENKLNVVTSIFNVSVVCLLNVLFSSPNENKLTHCGLFVRASVKEIKREIFEILAVRLALVGALAK